MAAIATSIVGELGTLLGGTGISAAIARGAVTGIAGLSAIDLINAIIHDLQSGGAPAAQARHAPKFAIVDLQANKIVTTLSAHRTYVILTHRRRGSRGRGSKHERVIVAPAGSEVVTVR